jgi:hypothetical protein
MGSCCVCDKDAEFGGHVIKDGEIISFRWCAEHKGEGVEVAEDVYELS